MIDTGIIITGAVGIITTIASSLITWLLSRKKYNAEVNHDEIENMHSSLDFYKNVEASTQSLLNELLIKYQANLEENIKLVQEVQELRIEVNTLTTILKKELGDSFDINKYTVEIVNA